MLLASQAAAQNAPRANPSPRTSLLSRIPRTIPAPIPSLRLPRAARSPEKTARANKVIPDEDMEEVASPLPRLKTDGAESADDIVASIAKCNLSHTPEQTEEAVHVWYDRMTRCSPPQFRRISTCRPYATRI
jgi:hypothetical protein